MEALDRVKDVLESNIGERVRLKANRGRRRTYVDEGVISDIYPSVFTVLVNTDDQGTRTLCYTYSDILTSNVELVVCKNNQRI
ncbi:MAG: Veg protein [Clostridiales bacterium]|nr:Veg protein [Clostridiales bacterium]